MVTEKISSKLLKVTIGENPTVNDINYTFTFTHINDDSKKATTTF